MLLSLTHSRGYNTIFTSMTRTFLQILNFVILPSCSRAVQSPFSSQGITPTWSSTLSELGYSEADIALILKGRRNRAPDLSSVHDCSPTVTLSRSQSLTSTYVISPPTRSTLLRRQWLDASISRSERSVRVTPAAPLLPLLLPPAP